jgi:hypothetical protein
LPCDAEEVGIKTLHSFRISRRRRAVEEIH